MYKILYNIYVTKNCIYKKGLKAMMRKNVNVAIMKDLFEECDIVVSIYNDPQLGNIFKQEVTNLQKLAMKYNIEFEILENASLFIAHCPGMPIQYYLLGDITKYFSDKTS